MNTCLHIRERQQAFESECLIHRHYIRRVLTWLGTPVDLVDDQLQEVFLLAWRAFDCYQHGTNAGAWLRQFAVNVNRRTRRQRRLMSTEEVEAVSLAGGVLQSAEYGIALDAIGRLDPRFRAVIEHRCLLGYSVEETSRHLGIPVGTVLSRLSRARRTLRREQ